MAQFVARNGLEFEQMTKQKQRDNPRFYFLFGGEYFNYYQYRVTSEQAVMRKNKDMQQQQQQQVSLASMMPQHPGSFQINSQTPQNQIWQNNNLATTTATGIQLQTQPATNLIQQQINEIQEQIIQSETNLAAQHQVIMQQQQIMIDEAIRQAQEDILRRLAEDYSINFQEFENVLLPISENCTKEAITVIIVTNNCY